MDVLVACEYSGTVRDAFRALGHNAVSCDLLDTDVPSKYHYTGDIRDIMYEGWDLMIAHPPCTFLTSAGNRWFYHPEDKDLPLEERRPHPNYPNRRKDQQEAIAFVLELMAAPINKIALENPVGILSSKYRKPNQVIQPWQFGHGVVKGTCLWLKNLPNLIPTDIVDGRYPETHYMSPSKDRWKLRSKTYSGIAAAMAAQWGGDIR